MSQVIAQSGLSRPVEKTQSIVTGIVRCDTGSVVEQLRG